MYLKAFGETLGKFTIMVCNLYWWLNNLTHCLCRLWGERVNLREQHDAFEFFNCLVDSLDEGLKAYGSLSALSKVLGGSFADQKICKGCPHRYVCCMYLPGLFDMVLNFKYLHVCTIIEIRYSREEPFTALNVDIRNKQHLYESLDAFVKGDLLEGANAYHCEKCDKKVHCVHAK